MKIPCIIIIGFLILVSLLIRHPMVVGLTFLFCSLILIFIMHKGKRTRYSYICANCGAGIRGIHPPERNTAVCPGCSNSQLILANTPRGRELRELYYGSTTIEERLQTAHEASKTLVEKLEGAVPATAVADELEKLSQLVKEGALSPDEWERAKNLILGKPKDKQADAMERVMKLHRAYKSGAISESEFNLTKWDILSRVGQG